jgi:hypothetical protein
MRSPGFNSVVSGTCEKPVPPVYEGHPANHREREAPRHRVVLIGGDGFVCGCGALINRYWGGVASTRDQS